MANITKDLKQSFTLVDFCFRSFFEQFFAPVKLLCLNTKISSVKLLCFFILQIKFFLISLLCKTSLWINLMTWKCLMALSNKTSDKLNFFYWIINLFLFNFRFKHITKKFLVFEPTFSFNHGYNLFNIFLFSFWHIIF